MSQYLSILMVDDDPDDKELFRFTLRNIAHPVTCSFAANGVEALKVLGSHILPDIIFLDLNMPLMNGKQCLKKIKESDRLKNIPVVIYSTSVYPELETELLLLGADEVMVKHCELRIQREQINFVIEKYLMDVNLVGKNISR